MKELSDRGRATLEGAAARQGIDRDAALILIDAVSKGGGKQAHFNHPALGGMGQWSRGGMVMIGDMSNNDLKHRLDTLCNEIAMLLENPSSIDEPRAEGPGHQPTREQSAPPIFFTGPAIPSSAERAERPAADEKVGSGHTFIQHD